MLKKLRHIIIGLLLLFTAGKTMAQNSMPDTVCKNTTRIYSVNDPSVPSTYTWKINGVVQATTTNSISIVWNTVGTFELRVQERSAEGCLGDEQAAFIYVMPLPIKIIDTLVCANRFPYLWNGISITGPGSYNYVTAGSFGCDSTTTLNVTTKPISTSTTIDSICADKVPYVWNGNNYTSSGTYTVTLVNSVGCDSIASLVLNVKPVPIFIINQPSSACEPETVNLTAPSITAGSNPGLTYTYWLDALATIPLTNPNAVSVSGTYYILAQGVDCAPNTAKPVNVVVHPLVPGVRYPTVTTSANTPTQLSARNIGASYSWSPSTGLNTPFIKDPIFDHDRQTEYRILITLETGCTTTDSVLVKIIALPGAIVKSDLFVPKAWTPNNDGHNDKLYPLTVNVRELKYFRVFNRWGQLVFETNQIGHGWDGIFNGKPQVMDVYTWIAEGIGTDGKQIKKAGNSVLIR